MLDTAPILMLAISAHSTADRAQQFVAATIAHLVTNGRTNSAPDDPGALHGDRGQATTEYALVLLAAALVALLVVAWATAGGGAARISRLFNRVIDSVIDKV